MGIWSNHPICEEDPVWGDNNNVIILNIDVLLLFWMWVVWVKINGHCVINSLFINMCLLPVSYWYMYWSIYKYGWAHWRCGVVLIRYNIWFLLWWWIVTCTCWMCTIWYHSGILVGGKSSSSGATIWTLRGVVPYVIGVVYGVWGVAYCKTFNCDSVLY